jgi:hypothetical protein
MNRLEAWLLEADLHDVNLSIDIRDQAGKGAPQVIELVLAPGRSGAAAVAINMLAWPDNEVDYFLSVVAGTDILSSAIEDRLDADSLLAICMAVAAGQLAEERLVVVGKTIGRRAAVFCGHSVRFAKSSGLTGLRLDRIAATLGLARLEQIRYPAWKIA